MAMVMLTFCLIGFIGCIYGLIKTLRTLPGPTYPIGPKKQVNGLTIGLERTTFSGAYTSAYVYDPSGRRVWKSGPKFSHTVDRMTADQLNAWLQMGATEYVRQQEEWKKFEQSDAGPSNETA